MFLRATVSEKKRKKTAIISDGDVGEGTVDVQFMKSDGTLYPNALVTEGHTTRSVWELQIWDRQFSVKAQFDSNTPQTSRRHKLVHNFEASAFYHLNFKLISSALRLL